MNVNIRFEGALERILDEAIRKGYASTKTEALRLGVLELNNRYRLLERMEDEADLREAERVMDEVRSGKQKMHRVIFRKNGLEFKAIKR